MAIAFDTFSQGSGGGATTATVSHTCTGTNLILVTFVEDNSANTVTGVTYNSVAMTQAGSTQQRTGDQYLSVWVLVNPTSGTHDVVATRSSAVGNFNVADVSYTGAKQSAQPDAQAQSAPTGTDNDQAVTIIVNNSWLVGAYYCPPASPTGTRLDGSAGGQSRDTGFPNNEIGINDSNSDLTTGSHSIGFTFAGSQKVSLQAISIAPASATSSNNFLLTGI